MVSSPFRAGLGIACGAILVLAGLTHAALQVTGARATRLELLLVYVALVVAVALPSARRARGSSRVCYGAAPRA